MHAKTLLTASAALLALTSFAGKWDAARAEWQAFRANFEPDYSDGAKYLLPKEGNRLNQPFVLVKDGKPAARIVCPRLGFYTDRFSTKVSETAATELQELVRILTGVKLPVCFSETEGGDLPAVFLGKSSFYPFDEEREIRHSKVAFARLHDRMPKETIRQVRDDLRTLRGSDGFAIRQIGRNLYVYGAEERGTLNGVYRLIENNSDIIFVRPNEEIGVVHGPETKDFALVWGKDVIDRPVLSGRGFWNMRHARYWNANLGTTTASDQWTDRFFHTFGAHNSSHFVPPASERPDLHGIVGGKRGDYGFMQCFSHPEITGIFRDAVLSHFDLRASRELAGVAIALDDTMNWCGCERCSQPMTLEDGTVVSPDDPAFKSTQVFRLLNVSADALAAAYPGKTIRTLAYFQTAEPPKCPVSGNLVIGYCPYMRADDKAPVYCEANEIWIDRLERWAEKVPDRRRLYLRGYDGLGLEFPRPLGHVHQRDWRLYQKHLGSMDHENPAQLFDRTEKDGTPSKAALVFDYSAIEYWVMGRLMWNVEEDVEGLYKQFCYRAYREAAKPMERFFGTIRRDFIRSELPSTIGERGESLTRNYVLENGREKELRGYLDAALACAKHPVSKELVRRVKARFETLVSAVKNAKTSSLSVPQIVPEKDPGFEDADWKNAGVIDRFYVLKSETEGEFPARMDLFHDGLNLYVRATMWEDMSKITSVEPTPGKEGVRGSKVEFFFADNANPGVYYLFRMDNAGGIADHRCYDDAWNRKDTKIAIRKFGDRWVTVLKIPLAEIGMNLIAENRLKAAFIRSRETVDCPGHAEYTGWKFCRFHNIGSFGTLTLQR